MPPKNTSELQKLHISALYGTLAALKRMLPRDRRVIVTACGLRRSRLFTCDPGSVRHGRFWIWAEPGHEKYCEAVHA